MVIVQLKGGLGNQMFQYAAGKSLSIARGVPLKLDTRRLQGNSYRQYQLGAFNIHEETATEEEIKNLMRSSLSTWLLMPIRPWIENRFFPPMFFAEQNYTFDPMVLLLGGNVYIKGFFQSEKYFLDAVDIIVDNFKLKHISPKAHSFHQEIIGCNSVSVHLRRGDYISKPGNLEKYGVCSIEYYTGCLQRILNEGGSPKFYIFSDELDWVRANMSFPKGTTFVTRDGLNCDAEELFLMSACRQHITSNSTFSWWGAWLDREPTMVAYTPTTWFVSDERDCKDLVPHTWIRV